VPGYLLSFRTPTDYQSTPDTRAAWNEFFQAISTHLEDIGNPIFSRQTIGETGSNTVLGGYTLIHAETLAQARELAAGCPLSELGGGVEIGELTPVSEMADASETGGQPTPA
jgi:hypothetical protein